MAAKIPKMNSKGFMVVGLLVAPAAAVKTPPAHGLFPPKPRRIAANTAELPELVQKR